jgi:hypothetical protein
VAVVTLASCYLFGHCPSIRVENCVTPISKAALPPLTGIVSETLRGKLSKKDKRTYFDSNIGQVITNMLNKYEITCEQSRSLEAAAHRLVKKRLFHYGKGIFLAVVIRTRHFPLNSAILRLQILLTISFYSSKTKC